MDDQPNNGRFSARIDDAFERWGIGTTLVIGLLVIFAGLGHSGLWDPWEMDRADLGRQLSSPAQVAVGLDRKSPLKPIVESLSEDLEIAPRFSEVPRRGTKSRPAVVRALRETVERAQKSLVTSALFEHQLLTPEGDDDAGWQQAYEILRDAHLALPNGEVLVASSTPVDAQAFDRALSAAKVRHTYASLTKRFALDEVSWPRVSDPFWDTHLDQGHGLERLRLIAPEGEGELRGALESALAGGHGGLVQYKDAGKTYTLPPLRHWMAAWAYGLFGASEMTARLPGALLAFLALLALVIGAKGLFGARVASVAGLILLTTPTFFAQARSVVGEPGAILALTLITIALLRHVSGQQGRAVWAWLLGGLVIGFLAKGLTAPLVYAAIATIVVVVALPDERRAWLPALVFVAAFALLTLWVETAPAHGFWGQFRFTMPLFSEGPTDYERNFDYAMKFIGFGLFPWSPLVVLAFAWALRVAVREENTAYLVLIAAFTVPTLVSMGFLKDFNHLLWPAAPVAALALALALERFGEVRGRTGTVMAFLVLIMGYILSRELGKSAEPLGAMLAFDPPFGDKAGARFPADLSVKTWARVALFMVVMPFVLHFSGVLRALKPVVAFFRRDTAWIVTLSAIGILLPLIWVIRVASAFAVGMDTTSARGLSVAQRAWHVRLLGGGDPLALLALGTLVVVGISWLVRHGILWRRMAGRTFEPRSWRTDSIALLTAAVAFAVLGLHMLWVVWPTGDTGWPEGYWSTVFLSAETLMVLGLAAIAFMGLRARGGLIVAASVVAILGLWLGTRLVRDLMFFPPVAVGATAAGGVAWALYVLPRLWRGPRQSVALGGLLVAGALLAWAMPMLERWDHISPFIYEGSQESLTRYLLVSSRLSWICYLAVIALLVNRRWPERVEWAFERVSAWLDREALVRSVALCGALVFSVALLAEFYPSLAHHVSQKHVLESYERAIEGDEDEAGPLYKHGRFDESDREDANFYTAGLPSITDRTTALKVLLAERDQVATLDTVKGSEEVLLPGFDAVNDADEDGARDHAVVRGVATELAPGRLTDSQASWRDGEHIGKVLVGAKGKAYKISANDATSLTLDTRAKPMLKVRVSDAEHYFIDSAESAEHRATALERRRRFLLLPADSLSELNHAFRKVSQGRHLPILDGRSSRVLLAGSWLEEGEEQENRFALHTLDLPRFEALDDPRIHRLWVNFDDTLRIVGYRLAQESVAVGQKIELTTYFQVVKKVKASQKIFLHIDRQGTSNRIHGDHWPLNQGVGDEPQKTCVGCYRSDHWFVGDVVTDVFTVDVPTGTTSGVYEIWMGLYNTSTDKRMVVKRWDKDKVRHDGSNRVRLGTLRVR